MKYEIWTKAMEEISDRHIVEAAKIQKKRRRPLWLGLTGSGQLWPPSSWALCYGLVEALWSPRCRQSARRNIRHLHPIRTSRPMPLGPPMRLGIRTRRRGGNGANNATRLWAPSSPPPSPSFWQGKPKKTGYTPPLSLYMALAMLAELTDGNSRQQVLDLLDVPDLETLRTRPRPCGSPTM